MDKQVLTFEFLEDIESHEKIPHVSIELPEDIHVDDEGIWWSDAGGENITHWMPITHPPEIKKRSSKKTR